MVKIEKGKLIIEMECDEVEHHTLQCLQMDLIYVLNSIHVLKNSHDPDFWIPSDLSSLVNLQKALMPTDTEIEILYPIVE